MLYPYRVHFCVTCCSWIRVQSNDDFRPDVHRSEVCGHIPLCHCGIFDSICLFEECWGYIIGQMEDPTFLWKFTSFSVKSYMPFLMDVCAFVIPFSSSGVLTGSHAKAKFTCDQLANGCVRTGVCFLVDVVYYLGWYTFLCFVVGSIVL